MSNDCSNTVSSSLGACFDSVLPIVRLLCHHIDLHGYAANRFKVNWIPAKQETALQYAPVNIG